MCQPDVVAKILLSTKHKCQGTWYPYVNALYTYISCVIKHGHMGIKSLDICVLGSECFGYNIQNGSCTYFQSENREGVMSVNRSIWLYSIFPPCSEHCKGHGVCVCTLASMCVVVAPYTSMDRMVSSFNRAAVEESLHNMTFHKKVRGSKIRPTFFGGT